MPLTKDEIYEAYVERFNRDSKGLQDSEWVDLCEELAEHFESCATAKREEMAEESVLDEEDD